jgi:hypothetical protein
MKGLRASDFGARSLPSGGLREWPRMAAVARLFVITIAIHSCAPDRTPPAWLVDQPRILAVVADAPEVSPGSGSTFRALAAGPNGSPDLSSADWSLCTAPLPLTESGSVAQSCLGDLPSLASGASAQIATSTDACALFGPNGSQASQRPRNPDATGGYYQPVRINLGGTLAFAEERLLCPLANASFTTSVQFKQTYKPNQNPTITSFALLSNGAPVSLDAVPAGARLTLSINWGADSNETFPVLDLASLTLVTQNETQRISWFTTGGTIDQAESGADPSGVTSTNLWTTPSIAGPVYLGAGLRDSRGGASWTTPQSTIANPN